jgi:hypothetical protein
MTLNPAALAFSASWCRSSPVKNRSAFILIAESSNSPPAPAQTATRWMFRLSPATSRDGIPSPVFNLSSILSSIMGAGRFPTRPWPAPVGGAASTVKSYAGSS